MLKRCARLMTVGGLVVTLFACGESAGPTDTAGASPAEALSATQRQFVGAWSLAGIERRGADGEPLAAPTEDRLGYLIYDAAGYMGVTIMRPDRAYPTRRADRPAKRRSPSSAATRRTSDGSP